MPSRFTFSRWLRIGYVLLFVTLLMGMLFVVAQTPFVFAAPGDLDTTFDGDGIAEIDFGNVPAEATALAVQTDGKIVLAGNVGSEYFALARLNEDGSIDNTFGTNGIVTTTVAMTHAIESILALPDGKILVGGCTTETVDSCSFGGAADAKFTLVRYNSDGSLDTTFNGTGIVTTTVENASLLTDLVLQPDGKVVAVGIANFQFGLARYNLDGSLDTTFGQDGTIVTPLGPPVGAAFSAALQPDGKILVGGGAGNPSGGSNPPIFLALARYNGDGSFDTSFGTNGLVTATVSAGLDLIMGIGIRPDGKILVGGPSSGAFMAGRFTADGAIDNTFGTNGFITTTVSDPAVDNDSVEDAAFQTDGKIVLGGSSSISLTINQRLRNFTAVRFTADGQLDPDFGTNGVVTTSVAMGGGPRANTIALQPDGKILLAGRNNTGPSIDTFAIVRYENARDINGSWDGEGVDNDWETPENWVGDTIPSADDFVLIAAGSSDIVANDPVAIGGMVMETGYTNQININSASFVVNGAFIQNAGTVNGAAGTIQVNGDFTLMGGTFNSTSGDLIFAGQTWTNNSFVSNGGTVEFAGVGEQTISGGSATEFNDLAINTSAIVAIPAGALQPTVEGTFSNSGALKQATEVNNDTVTFLEITDSTASTVKYRGVEIDTASNLGNVIVVIQDANNSETCASAATQLAFANRCYSINAITNAESTITLWIPTADLSEIADPDIYRNVDGVWVVLDSTSGTNGAYTSFTATTDGFSEFVIGEPLPSYTMTVTVDGDGTGTITSDPAGIDCGLNCSASYIQGSMVVLTATYDSGTTALIWSGACSAAVGDTCTVTMDQAQNVTATFDAGASSLGVLIDGNGNGGVTSEPAGIDCNQDGGTCNAGFDTSTVVTLTATAGADSDFTGWDGAGCSGTELTCAVTLDVSSQVTATFTLKQYDIVANKDGDGTGTVTSTPAGLNCGSTCTASFDAGTEVELTATADEGSYFAGWAGDCTGFLCMITIDSDTTVTATFTAGAAPTYTLDIALAGEGVGTVTSDPAGIDCGSNCSITFDLGTVVTLNATADISSTFDSWSGICSGETTAMCTFAIEADQTVTATFAAEVTDYMSYLPLVNRQ